MTLGSGGCPSARVLLSLVVGVSTGYAGQQLSLTERVEVARVIVDVRVVGGRGRPVLGLTPGDFKVHIGGQPVQVESAVWTGGRPVDADSLTSVGLTGFLEPETRGQLIVFVVQKSLEADRARGLLRLLQDSGRLLTRVKPADRVAVLSFDSHLKIWSDFTDDLDQVENVLVDDVMFGTPPMLGPQAGPSLLATLSQQKGRETYRIEEALQQLGMALDPLPGAKSVVLIGYGFGHLVRAIPTLDQRYDEARAALEKARAAVFSLDVTQADYHTFEHGLEVVAEDTGGFLAKTHMYARRAIDRVANAIVGYYVLFTEKPVVGAGRHEIEVELVRGEGTVFARSSYVE